MRKSWMIRKDLEGVSPVIGTILMVAITVVLAAVLYAMVATPPAQQENPMVGLVEQETGGNWTLLVSSVRGQVPLDMYPMSAVPLSQLTAQNWATYKVIYQKQKLSDTSVTSGSSILIDRAGYPHGCSYVLTTANNIVAMGAL
jgi:flagellin-like protein